MNRLRMISLLTVCIFALFPSAVAQRKCANGDAIKNSVDECWQEAKPKRLANPAQTGTAIGEVDASPNTSRDIAVPLPPGASYTGHKFYAKEGSLPEQNTWVECTNPDRTCTPTIGWVGFTPVQTFEEGGSIHVKTTLVNWSGDRIRSGRIVVTWAK